MAQNWADTDDVVMDNPVGGITRGWEEIRTVYERIFSGRPRVRVEFYDYTVHEAGEVGYAVGRERGAAGAPPRLDGRRRDAGAVPASGGRGQA